MKKTLFLLALFTVVISACSLTGEKKVAQNGPPNWSEILAKSQAPAANAKTLAQVLTEVNGSNGNMASSNNVFENAISKNSEKLNSEDFRATASGGGSTSTSTSTIKFKYSNTNDKIQGYPVFYKDGEAVKRLSTTSSDNIVYLSVDISSFSSDKPLDLYCVLSFGGKASLLTVNIVNPSNPWFTVNTDTMGDIGASDELKSFVTVPKNTFKTATTINLLSLDMTALAPVFTNDSIDILFGIVPQGKDMTFDTFSIGLANKGEGVNYGKDPEYVQISGFTKDYTPEGSDIDNFVLYNSNGFHAFQTKKDDATFWYDDNNLYIKSINGDAAVSAAVDILKNGAVISHCNADINSYSTKESFALRDKSTVKCESIFVDGLVKDNVLGSLIFFGSKNAPKRMQNTFYLVEDTYFQQFTGSNIDRSYNNGTKLLDASYPKIVKMPDTDKVTIGEKNWSLLQNSGESLTIKSITLKEGGVEIISDSKIDFVRANIDGTFYDMSSSNNILWTLVDWPADKKTIGKAFVHIFSKKTDKTDELATELLYYSQEFNFNPATSADYTLITDDEYSSSVSNPITINMITGSGSAVYTDGSKSLKVMIKDTKATTDLNNNTKLEVDFNDVGTSSPKITCSGTGTVRGSTFTSTVSLGDCKKADNTALDTNWLNPLTWNVSFRLIIQDTAPITLNQTVNLAASNSNPDGQDITITCTENDNAYNCSAIGKEEGSYGVEIAWKDPVTGIMGPYSTANISAASPFNFQVSKAEYHSSGISQKELLIRLLSGKNITLNFTPNTQAGGGGGSPNVSLDKPLNSDGYYTMKFTLGKTNIFDVNNPIDTNQDLLVQTKLNTLTGFEICFKAYGINNILYELTAGDNVNKCFKIDENSKFTANNIQSGTKKLIATVSSGSFSQNILFDVQQ